MSNTFTNQEDSQDVRATRESQRFQVPKRRGSKYADILLQKLQATTMLDNESIVIGVLGFANRQGVTTTAANLAIRAADNNYKPTLLIDGNCRSQKLTRMYRAKGNGFGECLNGHSSLESCVKPTKIQGCHVLGTGDRKLSKQIMFDPDIAGEFFKVVRNEFRFSVVDLPASNEPSYVDSILQFLDGVVLVAKYGARREQLEATQEFIQKANASLLAVVMTGNDDRLPSWVPSFLG